MDRWQQLVEYSGEQTEQSARLLDTLKQNITAVESQRQQMESYRQDYAQRAASPGVQATVSQLKTIRQFSAQVLQTVDELDLQLNAMRAQYEQALTTWRDFYNREQALKALQRIDQQKREVAEEKARRREEDDFAMLAKRRQRAR